MSNVFFIRGHAKSGTNWLCGIVNAHPDINARGEFHLEQLFQGLEDTYAFRWGLLKKYAHVLDKHYYHFIESLIVDICQNHLWCGDRTPGPIDMAYIPGKKCLYISRDGRDVLVSWTMHAFRNVLHEAPRMQEKQLLFDQDPNYFEINKSELLNYKPYVQGFGKEWNNIVLRDLDLMRRADDGMLKLDYLHVQYETLYRDFSNQCSRIFDFLGVDMRGVGKMSEQIKPGFGRIDNLSFYRRGEAGAWAEYFTEEQKMWFEEVAAEALERLGLNTY